MSNTRPPARAPYMATIAEENEWLRETNEFYAAAAADFGFTHYVKGLRNGSAAAAIVWFVKEVGTDRTVEMFEDRIEALSALDMIEAEA